MAVSTTGSRNGIITWAVTATVLGLGSLIWAVISFTGANKATKDMEALTGKYRDVIDNAGLAGEDVTALKAVREDATRGFGANTPLLTVARRQTDALSTLIAGSAATSDKAAMTDVHAAVDAAVKAAGKDAAIDSSSLVSTINGLTSALTASKASNDQLTKNLADAQKAATEAAADKGVVDATSNAKVADATKLATDAQAQADAEAKAHADQLAAAQHQTALLTESSVKGTDVANNEANGLRQQLAQTKREKDDALSQLKNFRVPTDQILTQADGVIVHSNSLDRCTINLGRGDQITAGLTFEVFDKLGVPRVRPDEPGDDKLLKGKASIEVVKTEVGVSECRIVRLSPGATISEGDPIVNIVYDKNVKYNFLVFGKFNLDYKGDATDRDADIVRRLISGWGANVTQKLDSHTDFVVLGDEPVVPNYTQDQLAREPEKAFEREQAETALEAYTDIRAKAQALNIPILRQTPFLYMIGYYEEGKR